MLGTTASAIHGWGEAQNKPGVWLGHRETLRGRLGSALGVPQGHATGGVRLLEVPWVCALELSKLRMLQRCEDRPGGVPCGKVTPEPIKSCPAAAKAAQDVSRELCAVPLASCARAPGTRLWAK